MVIQGSNVTNPIRKDVPKVSYHVKVEMEKAFKDQSDFKRFYSYFHERVCSPRYIVERFLLKVKGRTRERMGKEFVFLKEGKEETYL